MSTINAFQILNNKSIWFTDKYIEDFPEDSPERKLMEIFSYGTWEDYLQIKDSLPESLILNANSIACRKLKALSILTIMDNFIEIETLIIDLFGSDLMVGKIDEKNHMLTIDRAASRCIPNTKEAIQDVIDNLNVIREKISSVTN